MAEHDAAADAFAERLFGTLVQAFDLYGLYLGDKLGYYRVLAAEGPLTSERLAERTGTVERLAREWLEQQAAGGILLVDDAAAAPTERRFSIPAAHAEVLTDADSSRYLAAGVKQVTTAGLTLPELVATYRGDRTLSWPDYGQDMRDAQAEMNRPLFLSSLGAEILRSIPGVHERLSSGGRIADIGCGYGWSTIAMALTYPDVEADGFDPDEPSVYAARGFAKEHGVDGRVRFHARDAGDEAIEGSYDLVTAFECVHDLSYPVAVLGTMRRLRRDGGTVIVMDERVAETFDPPVGDVERFFYGWSITSCLPDGLSAPNAAGTGTVMRPETLRAYAREAGFEDVEVLPVENDFFRFYRLV